MAEILLTAKGTNGQLQFEGDVVRILRKGAMGFLTQGIKGDKEIYVGDISSIQMKNAGRMTRGYIQFAFTGGREAKGGLLQATRDENTVMFDRGHQKEFDAIKFAIEEHRTHLRRGGEVVSAQPLSAADEIKKFADLLEQGIISRDEFEVKKKELLGL